MTIKFNIEPKDMRAFRRYHTKHDFSYKVARYISLAIIIASCTFTSLVDVKSAWDFIWFFSVQFIIFFLAYRIFVWVGTKISDWWTINPKRQKGVLCEHTITLQEDILIESTSVNENRQAWSGVLKVAEDKNYIFIYTTVNVAHIIPKRAFETPEAANEFFQQAKHLHLNAKENIKQSV